MPDVFTETVIESLHLDHLTCDMVGCGNPASGFLICPCKSGRETQCQPCRLDSHGKAWTGKVLFITFTGTCNHTVQYLDCGWELIKS